ncbi:MAG: condensation domain-containing protein [Vicinamibacterales bacterium]
MNPGTKRRRYPLSYCQEWIWLLQQLQPGCLAYHVPFAFCIEGDVNPWILEKALHLLVRRHDLLRTGLTMVDDRPAQRTSARARLALQRADLEDVHPLDRGAVLDAGLQAELREPFDLAHPPLARARLFRLERGTHVLSLILHHLVADAWSARVCLRDLLAFYRHLRDGIPLALEPLPMQYAAYVEEQRTDQYRGLIDRDIAYWRQELQHAPPPGLTFDRPAAPNGADRAGQLQWTLPSDLIGRMRAVAAQTHTTLFMTVLAAWYLALRQRSGCDDLVVGVVVADRARVDVEPLIGCFINVLPVRIRTAGERSSAGLLATVRRIALSAYTHMHVPFMSLVRALAPPRGAHQQTYFDSIVNWLPDVPAAFAGGLRMSARSVRAVDTDVPITLYVEPHGATLDLRLLYRTDLLLPATAADCLRGFRDALDTVVASDSGELP